MVQVTGSEKDMTSVIKNSRDYIVKTSPFDGPRTECPRVLVYLY